MASKVKDSRPSLTSGLTVSWIAQILQIVAGFLIPRMIDGGMGPVTLGVWDFGWSLVSSFGLLHGGIGSSASRFIALERSRDNREGINRIASSAALIQRLIGVLILVLTCAIAWGIPYNLPGVGVELEREARWLVFLLGCAVGLSMLDAIYTGILTGCHRWATHHAIYAVTTILSVVGMVMVLALGYGLVALGIVHLACELLGRLLRRLFSYRACPGLKISMAAVDRHTMRTMIGFGGRMALGKISRVILNQTNSILIMMFLGPAALAMFVRPRSLVRQAAVFPQKYCYMLVPTVATLSGPGSSDQVRAFVISSCRNGLYMSVPIITFLLVGGTLLVELWMGKTYADPLLIAAIVMALASEVFYQPLDNLLIGLNLHGRPALVMLGAALAAVGFSWAALHNGFGLLGVAISMGIPWTFAHAIYLPLYGCKRLEMPVSGFLRAVWAGPLACAFPFALLLIGGRLLFPDQPLFALASGAAAAGLFLALCYWRWVLDPGLKRRIIGILRIATLRSRRSEGLKV